MVGSVSLIHRNRPTAKGKTLGAIVAVIRMAVVVGIVGGTMRHDQAHHTAMVMVGNQQQQQQTHRCNGQDGDVDTFPHGSNYSTAKVRKAFCNRVAKTVSQ